MEENSVESELSSLEDEELYKYLESDVKEQL